MKKIIYATDFSENSVAALTYAYHLGKLLKLDVIVLHVFDPDDLSPSRSAEERKQVIDHHNRRLQKFCSLNLQQNFEDLNLSLAVIQGEDISREILHYIRDINVLRIVMGACGSGTVREFFLGSTIKNMISASFVPVMAIPGNFEFRKINKVMYTTDFEEEDIYHQCELLTMLAPLELRIIIVHVTTGNEEEASDLMEWFKELLFEKTSFPNFEFRILQSQDVLGTLNNCLDEIGADLLVMMERKSKLAVQRVLHRDLVKSMQSYAHVPLLSCKDIR